MAKTGKPLRVYTLDDLPPEVVAVAFAKTSRSPASFDDIARELSETDSSDFHEKWVVGYGHSSVAEHAVLSIAIENVSILGAKVVEENRLSSFTEKSTRYQVMGPDNYYTPPCFADGHLGGLYRDAVAKLYAAYASLMPQAERHCEEKYGDPECKARGVTPGGKSCDTVRGLLPAAAKTNLGWTVNARSLRHALVKMASSPLAEMRELAQALIEVGTSRVPTLLRYTEPSDYLAGWEDRVAGVTDDALHQSLADAAAASDDATSVAGDPDVDWASGVMFVGAVEAPVSRKSLGTCEEEAARGAPSVPCVRLVEYDPDGERSIAAAVLYHATGHSYDDIRSELTGTNRHEIEVLLTGALHGIGGHEAPVREFESTDYTFEITCDFGAYRDIQRHRMTSQTQQLLTCDLGYVVPNDAKEAGIAERMAEVLEAVAPVWRELSEADSVHAQYLIPLAYRKRFLMKMNFREAYQLVRLRSKVQGHESYRRVAWAMKDEIERVHPLLGALMPAEYDEWTTAGEVGITPEPAASGAPAEE